MARIGFRRRRNMAWHVGMVAALAIGLGSFIISRSAVAQLDGGGGIGGGTGTPTAGVAVDADGVLRRTMVADPTGQLARQRAAEALSRLDPDVARRSKLRKVSLTRLERIIESRQAAGGAIDDNMLHLAGLTRLEYVFCYPETGDIVIAGPAEPWGEAPSGRVLGIETGRPVLQLQDLVVALRAFPPNAHHHAPLIYCSIDPTPDGLRNFQRVLRQIGRNIRPGDAPQIVQVLQESQGMHQITVGGVSAKTHFAQVMVEADYRMKLIGIGLERPPVRLTSYVDRANPAHIARNALQRWFFVPDYQCVRVSDDALAMQVIGDGVRLVGENEVVGDDGTRRVAGGTNQASESFVRAFTKVYPKLAERAPIYAELRNCIDLAVAAAFIQHQDYYGLVNWEAKVFGDEQAVPVETCNAPKEVAAAINAVWKGNTLLTPIGGGVQMRPTEALQSANLLDDEQHVVDQARAAIDLSHLAPDQWWWD